MTEHWSVTQRMPAESRLVIAVANKRRRTADETELQAQLQAQTWNCSQNSLWKPSQHRECKNGDQEKTRRV